MAKTNVIQAKNTGRKKIPLLTPALCVLLTVAGLAFSGCGKPSYIWYVHPEYERAWNQVLQKAKPPLPFKAVQLWEETGEPPEAGIWITPEPWERQGRVEAYYRLSYDLEYRGAIVLALDPWMIFRKHTNPELSLNRVYSNAGGGLLLIPGRDPAWVQAWTARLIQERPGVFPSDEKAWRDCEAKLFAGSRFPSGAQSYTWQDVLFRLMGNDQAWVYAPLSAIRRYSNPQKAILEATAFPEPAENNHYSLQAKLLWALPSGSDRDKEKLAPTLAWLREPETQTVIADVLEWIPADPYGKPYDPVSLSSHRNWLTASFVYDVH